MKVNKKLMQQMILESVVKESRASEMAKSAGLLYRGYGRYVSDDGTMYKSDGNNLIPIESTEKKETPKQSFFQKLAKKVNNVTQTTNSAQAIIDKFVEALPQDKKYANDKALSAIIKNTMQFLIPKIQRAFQNKEFRVKLKISYFKHLENIEENPVQQQPQQNAPKPNNNQKPMTQPMQLSKGQQMQQGQTIPQ
jgi:hypothetical protein